MTVIFGQILAYSAFSDSHFSSPGFAISLYGIDGAFRFANATVDAFVRMNDEHVLALVEAVQGHTSTQSMVLRRMQLSLTTLGVLPADCRGQPMCAIVVLARWLKMDAQKIYVLWLNRNTEQ